MAEPFIYCGNANNGTVDIFDRGENLIKNIDLLRYDARTFGIINKIRVDSDGCIYAVINYGENGGYESGGSIRKYGAGGSLKWIQENMWSCGHLDIDANGNVYVIAPGTGAPEVWPGSVRKYNNDGVLQWAKTFGGLSRDPWFNHIIPICVKSDGSLVVAGGSYLESDAVGLVAYDGDGDLLWNVPSVVECYAVTIDETDNDYIYALQNNSDKIVKIDSADGTIISVKASYYDISGTPRAVSIDNNGDFIATMSQINSKSAFKFDSSLNVIWVGSTTAPTNSIAGNSVFDVDCDADGNIYTINAPSPLAAGIVVRDNDGQPLWISDSVGFAGYRSVCVGYPTSIPPIDISVYFGVPTWEGDRYVNVPGLPVSVTLGLVQAWRDYVGARKYPEVYRLFLTGTPNIELPISSLQCRADLNSVTLSLVVPALTSALVAAIESRLAGELMLMKGIRFPSGAEEIDEMIRVPLDSLRYDLGPQSGSASLSGTSATTGGGRARTLNGISYRNTIGGVRRARCSVDTYLQPGDTANLGGGETLVVAEIVYNINTRQATMEISE